MAALVAPSSHVRSSWLASLRSCDCSVSLRIFDLSALYSMSKRAIELNQIGPLLEIFLMVTQHSCLLVFDVREENSV